MKNTKIFSKIIDQNAHVEGSLKEEVEKTNGHIIVSWSDEVQIENKDLIKLALSLDDHNLSRIHNAFFIKFKNEMLDLMTLDNHYLFPENLLYSDEDYAKKYMQILISNSKEIGESFSFIHIDTLRNLILENNEAIKSITAAVQEELSNDILKIISKNPDVIKYIKEDVLYSKYVLAQMAVSVNPETIYYLPDYYIERFPKLLCYLNKTFLEDICANGMINEDDSISYITISDIKLIAQLLKISPYAILLASTNILLSMKSKKLNERLSDVKLRSIFIERKPIISKLKKVQP